MNKKHRDFMIGCLIAIIFFTSLSGAEGFACSLIGCLMMYICIFHG